MAAAFRRIATEKIFSALTNHGTKLNESGTKPFDVLQWGWRLSRQRDTRSVQLELPLNYLISQNVMPDITKPELQDLLSDVASLAEKDDVIHDMGTSHKCLIAHVDKRKFYKTVLSTVFNEKSRYGFNSNLYRYKNTAGAGLQPVKERQRIVVEFSSPNIAKPFHAGHLRSTVIGHALASYLKAVGHDVTRINYLGDWGTQFGYLGVGFSKFGSEEKLAESPMQHLFDVYVRSNKEATQDPAFHQQAMNFFASMEAGDPTALEFWQKCHDKSIEEYKRMYKRLGIEFDVYEGESHYRRESNDVIQQLADRHLLLTRQSTGQKYIDLTDVTHRQSNEPEDVVVQKSDGTSLYVTRDIAAFISRKRRYEFDRLLYVVDSGQRRHFQQLLLALQKMSFLDPGQRHSAGDYHIDFGRVGGMSTRKGEVVFLTDILDEATERMKQNMLSTDTTKVSDRAAIDDTALALATSGLIIHNLKHSRIKGYNFDWEKLLTMKNNSGPYAQYQHARLCSLVRQAHARRQLVPTLDDVRYEVLLDERDDDVMALVMQIAGFDEALVRCYDNMEMHHVVRYLFELCHASSKVFKYVTVMDAKDEKAKARLLLFDCARQTMSNALRMLGITPLERM